MQLETVVKTVKKEFGLDAIKEFTIEVNPNDITPEYAAALAELGVNRVSMGIQSVIDSHLQWMNRRHTAAEGESAYNILHNAGIKNISLDLIFGYQLLTNKEWEYNLDKITSLQPQHISAYQLSVEPGSSLATLARAGKYRQPTQEECWSQYALLQKKLAAANYLQYEVSNFALCSSPGQEHTCFRSMHNSSYWNKTPYLGLGPAAHSFSGVTLQNGTVTAQRSWNHPSVKKYCDYYLSDSLTKETCINETGVPEKVGGGELLTPTDIFNETIMLGLRQTKGFSLAELDKKMLQQIEPEITKWVSQGYLEKEEGYIKIPPDKLFVSDGIIRDLFI